MAQSALDKIKESIAKQAQGTSGASIKVNPAGIQVGNNSAPKTLQGGIYS